MTFEQEVILQEFDYGAAHQECFDQEVDTFSANHGSATLYLDSKSKLTTWFLERNLVPNNARYQAAKFVALREEASS